MANNQELQEDFSQDVKDDQHLNGEEATGENGRDNGTENGNDNGNDNGANDNENSENAQSYDASGRDDDRLVEQFPFSQFTDGQNCNYYAHFVTHKKTNAFVRCILSAIM